MRRPAGHARHDEYRRKHRRRNTHHVVGNCGEPVQVGKHLLDVPHHVFQSFRNTEQVHVPIFHGQLFSNALDDLVTGVCDGIDGMAEPDHDLFPGQPFQDIRLGLIRVCIALLDFHGHLVGAAVLGAAQCADGAGNGRIHVRSRSGDDPAGEGRGVEFMFRIQDQGGVHGAHP